MRRVLYLLPVAVFLALAGYFAVALRPGHDSHELPSAMIDKEAPPFDLARLNGVGTLSPDALRGHPVVINFFASWCVPCRQEHPLRLLAQMGDPYTAVGVDREGRTGLDFGVYGVPETYVLDASGHIRKRFVGPLTVETVDKELLPLLRTLGWS
jgi:cytochrome c biogenesis protein CcmG, thiol:disulfide interchange protein DsbE